MEQLSEEASSIASTAEQNAQHASGDAGSQKCDQSSANPMIAASRAEADLLQST